VLGLVPGANPIVQSRVAHGVSTEQMTFGGHQREYAVFLPNVRGPSTSMPLVVLLHGSGGDGRALVESWKDLASAEGFAIVGPTALNRREWSVPEDGPGFLYELVEILRRFHSIDCRRVYLFGHSAGGVFGLYMGAAEADYFAAVAAHAAAFNGETDLSLLDVTSRKIPVLMIAGTQDPVFPVERVRATAKELESRGFPLTLMALPGRGHDYKASASLVSRASWEFLQKHRLAAEPRYIPYEFH
jgi:poly(3-hydroxybutyrate) depolymerase